MVIQSNPMAINTRNYLNQNESKVQKSIRALSTGFRINSAADDSSGLAVSEKMKALIRGLDQAVGNSLEGINLVATAEGALGEIHEMLGRMAELAEKSANGVLQDEVDREALQQEFDTLTKEIDRITKFTKFNQISLFQDQGLDYEQTAAETAKSSDHVNEILADDGNGSTFSTSTPASVAAVRDVYAAGTYPNNLFTVIGGTLGTDYRFNTNTGTLTILKAGTYTIKGGSSGAISGNIVVAGVAADITLEDVNISFASSTTLSTSDEKPSNSPNIVANRNKTALYLAPNCGNVNLTLKGNNVLHSGDYSAGVFVGKGTTLTIDGDGKLDAQGGQYGAGIGICTLYSSTTANLNGGNIIINSGNIVAKGGFGGAGIGGAGANNNDKGTVYDMGDITIHDGTIVATSKAHGAGIGGGWGRVAYGTDASNVGKITITGGTITAKSTMHGTGIGAGCLSDCDEILITGGKITAEGGSEGAGIGASWNGNCDKITITDGIIKAIAGEYGAGIGAGRETSADMSSSTHVGSIDISGGEIYAQGGTNGAGIGVGAESTVDSIRITGGVITALGGLTNGGGNIEAYSDRKHNTPSSIVIAGDNLTLKSGSAGEGLYNTSGAKDMSGNWVYGYNMSLIKLLNASGTTLYDLTGASDIKISSKGKASGTILSWNLNLRHEGTQGEIHVDDDSVFLWMNGEDQEMTVEYTDAGGNIQTVVFSLKFWSSSGLFRPVGDPEPPAASPPNNASGGNPPAPPIDVPPVIPPTPPDPPDPVDPPEPPPEEEKTLGGIILQIGANKGEILEVPRFYLSADALHLTGHDISTQKNAWETMGTVKSAINRVSGIRSTYGSIQNRLEHNIHTNTNTSENLSSANSAIRDADMAKEMMNYTKMGVLTQSSQAMLAQIKTVFRDSINQLLFQ